MHSDHRCDLAARTRACPRRLLALIQETAEMELQAVTSFYGPVGS